MASGMARREVPDSEDEPMTSSPVDTSDGAADKLFATARVPLQDAQDALQEATGTHQATAESIANVPGKGCEGLDADQNDASTDVDASKHVSNGVQSEPTTSSQWQSTGAGSSTADPLLPSIASPLEVRVDHMDAQHAAANTSSDGQHEAERDLTDETNATTSSETDITPSVPDVDLPHEQMSDRTSSEIASRKVAPEQVNQASSSEAANDARHITGPRDDQPNASKTVTDTTGDQRDVSLAHAESLGGDCDVKHSTEPQDAHGSIKATSFGLSDGGQDQTGGKAPGNKSASSSADHGTTSLNSSTPDPALTQSADFNIERYLEPNSNHDSSNSAPAALSACPEDQQDLTQSGSLHPKSSEESIVLPEVSSAQARQTKVDLSEHAAGTENLDTAMDVDTSPSTAVTETQATMTDVTSSAHTTNSLTDTFAPAADTSVIPMDTSNTTAATDSHKSDLVAPSPTSSSQLPAPPVPTKTPQEVTLAELKAQKTAMLASLAALPAIQVLMEEHARATHMTEDEEDDEPTEADIMLAANKIVKDHIKLLHEYNELKDVGQGLMGLIADQRGVRIVEVNEDFGIEEGD